MTVKIICDWDLKDHHFVSKRNLFFGVEKATEVLSALNDAVKCDVEREERGEEEMSYYELEGDEKEMVTKAWAVLEQNKLMPYNNDQFPTRFYGYDVTIYSNEDEEDAGKIIEKFPYLTIIVDEKKY